MSKKNKQKKMINPTEYIISDNMKALIDGLKAVGYSVEVYSGKDFCYNGKFDYIRYCTRISIDEYDGEGNAFEFVFDPRGKRITDYDFNSAYCERVK